MVFLSREGATLSLGDRAVRLRLVGAKGGTAEGLERLPGTVSYFIGIRTRRNGTLAFPPTPGAYQPVQRAADATHSNAFVTRLNASGTALVSSTYLGGTGLGGTTLRPGWVDRASGIGSLASRWAIEAKTPLDRMTCRSCSKR